MSCAGALGLSNSYREKLIDSAVFRLLFEFDTPVLGETGLKMSWTDDRVDLLKQLWLDGKSASQISSILGSGVTRNAVIGKVHRLGLAGRAKLSSAALIPNRASRTRVASHRQVSAVLSRPRVIGNNALAIAHEFRLGVETALQDNVVPLSIKVTIIELKDAMCRWPLGDPTSADFRYCGAGTATSPYCTYHFKLAYQPSLDRRRERISR